MVKLYQPYGGHKSVRSYGAVTIHWFVKDRPEPILPYEQMIQGYQQLRGEDQVRAQMAVDELLSETEFATLRAYLYGRHGDDLRTEIFALPISVPRTEKGSRSALHRPFSAYSEVGTTRFYRLAEEPDYDLLPTIWGAYAIPQVYAEALAR